jgi:hypothetical protein
MPAVVRKTMALGLCESIVSLPITDVPEAALRACDTTNAAASRIFAEIVSQTSSRLCFKIEFSCEEIKNQRRALDRGESLCVAWFPAPKGAWETRLECLVI